MTYEWYLTRSSYRVLVGGRIVPVRALFWKEDRVIEIRYIDPEGELAAIKGEQLKDVTLLASTGVKETGKSSFVFEGDVVEIEYQRGTSTCVVEWCKIKSSFVLRPISGNRPPKQVHFRLSGKKLIRVVGNVFQDKFEE